MSQGAVRAAPTPPQALPSGPPGLRRGILRQGHGHLLQQVVQNQLGCEQGRCPAASPRKLVLGTNIGVTVAMPVAAVTALRRQSRGCL
jgi:hypothetical protein